MNSIIKKSLTYLLKFNSSINRRVYSVTCLCTMYSLRCTIRYWCSAVYTTYHTDTFSSSHFSQCAQADSMQQYLSCTNHRGTNKIPRGQTDRLYCTHKCHQNYHPKEWRTSCYCAEEYATSELCRSIRCTVIKFLLA